MTGELWNPPAMSRLKIAPRHEALQRAVTNGNWERVACLVFCFLIGAYVSRAGVRVVRVLNARILRAIIAMQKISQASKVLEQMLRSELGARGTVELHFDAQSHA